MVPQILNPGQLKAVTYTEVPLLILAEPGYGKTPTITEKVVDLTEKGASSEKILTLLLSDKATVEMQEMPDIWFDFEQNNSNEPVNMELDVAHFAGSNDRLDRTHDGDYVIFDYKTGNFPLNRKKRKEDVHMALYCLAVKEEWEIACQGRSLLHAS